MKTTPCTVKNKTMCKHYAYFDAPRCGAKTRKGVPCKSPSVKGKKRCRVHGCAKGSGAPKGNQNAFKHGGSTKKMKLFKRNIKTVLQDSKVFVNKLVISRERTL